MNNHLCWLPENFVPEKVDIKKLKHRVFRYAYNIIPLAYNARIYPKFASKFKKDYEGNDISFDLQGFKAFQEHKVLLLQIIKEFAPNSSVLQEFQSVINLVNAMQTVALKYNMTKRNKEKAIETICDALYKLRIEEPKIMKKFYRELKSISQE